MKIGDECYVHGYVDEIRNDTIIIRNEGGYFGTAKSEVLTAPAEYVRVVRCKDCKYAMKQYITNLPWLAQWEYSCRYYNTHSVMGDDWCSRAERKEE